MSTPYWPKTLPVSYGVDLERTVVDVRAEFEVDVGEPISRPRTTGAPYMANPKWYMTDVQVQAFEQFYETTLAQGSRKFIMRDILRDTVRWWKFTGPARAPYSSRNFAVVSANVLIFPHVPWFGSYVRNGESVVPSFVADYENDVYGIEGVRKTAADLPTIEGTYYVVRVTTSGTTEGEETLTAGDITEAQPAGTLRIVGYPA